MATYTMYWPDWMCDRAREQGLEGQPLRLLWGGHNQDSRFSRFKVGPGDVVVPVTAVDGVLHALASLHVVEKTTAEPWVAAHPEDAKLRLHGCGSELLVGDGQGTPLRFDRAFTGKQLEQWRYDGTDGERPLKFLESGRLKKTMSLQGVYRVTEATARLIAKVLAAAAPEAPQGTAADLEAALRAKPDDEQTARVLADVWQEAGDVRGEILALEIALAKETDPAKAAELDRRHAALMRKTAGLKKQAGGFPFRRAMGSRGFLDLSLRFRLAPGDKEASASSFHAFATRLIDSAGFARVQLLGRAGLHQTPPELEEAFAALGAKRTAFGAWARKSPFSVAEFVSASKGHTAWLLEVEGRLRATDDGAPLPLQAPSQWLGSAPASVLKLRLPLRTPGEGGLVWGTLHVPLGNPLAEARARELKATLESNGAEPVLRAMVRTATGDRAENPEDDRAAGMG